MRQKELANRLGLHINTLRNWLTGRCYPSMAVTQDILAKLGYDVIIVDKKKNEQGLPLSEQKLVCSFNSYEMGIYERGRKSAFNEMSNKVKPVLKDIERNVV